MVAKKGEMGATSSNRESLILKIINKLLKVLESIMYFNELMTDVLHHHPLSVLMIRVYISHLYTGMNLDHMP